MKAIFSPSMDFDYIHVLREGGTKCADRGRDNEGHGRKAMGYGKKIVNCAQQYTAHVEWWVHGGA